MGRNSPLEALAVATRLGLTSFGGPVAHLGYFRNEYVQRRQWVDEATYADIVAMCQVLPGPASSQVGIAVGYLRAGFLGAVAAWVGFTIPSAVALVLFAYSVRNLDAAASGWLHGLQIVAVAVVAQAVLGMARSLAPARVRGTIALLATAAALNFPTTTGQVGLLIAAGIIGWRWCKFDTDPLPVTSYQLMSKWRAVAALVAFFALLLGLPVLLIVFPSQPLAIVTGFYRAGSLVFGGGHVVLPLLQAVVVQPDWVTNEQFLAGYGAAQAVPGPLFSFAAYLGAVMRPQPHGWIGAAMALVAIYVPSFLLVLGILPFWSRVRSQVGMRAALRGVNAAVVGLLLAALYQPVWTSAILSPTDFGLAVVAFGLLFLLKLPPWLVVVFGAAGGAVMAIVP